MGTGTAMNSSISYVVHRETCCCFRRGNLKRSGAKTTYSAAHGNVELILTYLFEEIEGVQGLRSSLKFSTTNCLLKQYKTALLFKAQEESDDAMSKTF